MQHEKSSMKYENPPTATEEGKMHRFHFATVVLIGDHEDHSYSDEPWFLPTHEYPYNDDADIGNDEWYTYFDEPESVDNAMPSMFVGRLSVKNGGESDPDTLSTLIYNLIDLEDPITSQPIPNYRRRILRLAGTGKEIRGDPPIFHQNFGIDNKPLSPWTLDFTDWLSYDYTSHYCGDGRWFTNTESDSSDMESVEWLENCITEFSRGAGVAFYTNHGELHFFSAGLEWCPWLYNFTDESKGCRDSTFNNYQIEQNLTSTVQGYSAPFNLLLCCSAGTFNHTLYDHQNRTEHIYFCFDDWSDTMQFDFTSDCLAEKILKNTDVPVAGVFSGSQPSSMGCYNFYGKGILEAIYARGHGRLGDAIASARAQYEWYFTTTAGAGVPGLGQFNLLGDPALDISDRVRFPDHCDLSIYPGEVIISQYPVETSTGIELPLSFKVRNNGAQDSEECDIRVILRNGANSDTEYLDCDAIDAGDHLDFQYTWDCPAWFQPPMVLIVSIEVDYDEECDDCWWPNNTASMEARFNDTYPVLDGWILAVDEVINTAPILANIDNDSNLEIVILEGNSLVAYEDDGTEKWKVSEEAFLSSVQILASDLESDGMSEFIVAYNGGIKVIASDGEVLDYVEVATSDFVIGDMSSVVSGPELCLAVSENIYLYSWDSTNDEFDYQATKTFSFSPARFGQSLSCADLVGNSYEDVAYCTEKQDVLNPFRGLLVHDWDGASTPYDETWSGNPGAVCPAVGELDGTRMIGYPFGAYQFRTESPAAVITPSSSIESDCDEGDCDANMLRYGVFVDWDFTAGAETFVLPSEMQAMAWGNIGDPYGSWPTDEYSDAVLGSQISPTSLGDLDNSGDADVLFSTKLDGICTILAYSRNSLSPSSLDFPITLPDDVTSFGGFSIADIDRDGAVELVFGTSDGYLHCWELGSCTTGYIAWPQFQHDDGRTGVLE